MERVLVLSGGGAKGAFQVGALEYIKKHRSEDFNYKLISGVSVGALNGAMVAQNNIQQLIKLWNEITNDKVYTGKVNVPSAIWRIIRGRKSILGIKPLIRQIEDNIDIKNISIPFRCGLVSLISGEYMSLKHLDFNGDNENFRKAILGSATMPIIWEPVDQVKVGQEVNKELVDGGVRNLSPLKDVIDEDPEEIVIINCSNEKIDSDPNAAKNIFQIAIRSLTDITLNEIFRSDIEEFVKINDIVEQCKEAGLVIYKDKDHKKPYKYFKAIIIEPEDDLGDALDFSQPKVQERKQAGFEAAKAAYSKYNPNKEMVTVRSFK